MRLKKLLIPVLLLSLAVAGYVGYRFYGGQTSFEGKRKFIFIKTGDGKMDDLISSLRKDSVLEDGEAFGWQAK
jgi:hypothetical protein